MKCSLVMIGRKSSSKPATILPRIVFPSKCSRETSNAAFQDDKAEDDGSGGSRDPSNGTVNPISNELVLDSSMKIDTGPVPRNDS
jgi:hypothetical protein